MALGPMLQLQLISLNMHKIILKMFKFISMEQNYIMWWTPQQQAQLMAECDFLNYNYATFQPPSYNYPSGFFFLLQNLTPSQFQFVDNLSNNQKLMDIKPSPHPPYNPTQR